MKHLTCVALMMAILALGGLGCRGGSETHSNDALGANTELTQIIGTDKCAECEGITGNDQDVLLVESDGTLWVLIGGGPGYQAAQDGHNEGKTIAATLAGKPVTKTGLNGKLYREVKVSDIKIIG